MRRAKIVATIGPAIESPEKISEAIKAGLNVARLNMSHGDHAEHQARYDTIREQSAKLGKDVAILADLQGPKIRLERFANGKEYLEPGADFTITSEDVEGTAEICGTTYKGLPGDVKPGDKLLLDDGKIRLEAIEVTPTRVRTRVVVGGPISNNKGINLPGAAVSLPALTEKDANDLRFALKMGADIIALSFVRTGADVDPVHKIMDEEGIRVPVIAKIEKPQAVENLQDIIDKFDGIMVARGDLGVELPFSEVPLVQKKAIDMARRWAKPVMVNPSNFRKPKRDDILVSVAGPAMNLLLGFLAFYVMIFIRSHHLDISPITYSIIQMIFIYNVNFAIFNMLPIPPLDGSHILRNLLPPDLSYRYQAIERYSLLIMIVFIATPLLGVVLTPLFQLVYGIYKIVGGILLF